MKTAIGLMSGTSMDGIDVALIRTDGEGRVERGPGFSLPYESAFRDRLKQALVDATGIVERTERPGCLGDVEQALTERHGEAVLTFLAANGLSASHIDVIGFHGQTVLHRPDDGLTVQLGNGARLSRMTGIATVYDMRANDMRHGGQGAPLIPVYHAALAASLADRVAAPVVFVNIGGISNLTYVAAEGDIVAFDSGPGNTLIDQWVEAHGGGAYDAGGRIAARGSVVPELAAGYLAHGFFTSNTRKSLDRNDFRPPVMGTASLEDGARTLAYVTAAAIMASARHLPRPPATYLVSGGGRLNAVIMDDLAGLAHASGASVLSAEQAGLNGDSMEAEAWGYLAVRALLDLPLTFPGTTGVRAPVSGGVLARPEVKGA